MGGLPRRRQFKICECQDWLLREGKSCNLHKIPSQWKISGHAGLAESASRAYHIAARYHGKRIDLRCCSQSSRPDMPMQTLLLLYSMQSRIADLSMRIS